MPTDNQLNKILVNEEDSIKETMRVIDLGRLGVAFVRGANKKILGSISDGDIRWAILQGIDIEKPIKEIVNKNPIILTSRTAEQDILRLKNNPEVLSRIRLGDSLKIPVFDEMGDIQDIFFLYGNGRYDSLLKPKIGLLKEKTIKKVLIIGGAGYLGSVLSAKLLKSGYLVRVLDNLTYGDEGIKNLVANPNFEFIKGDIRNISDVIEALRDVGACIHLAAIVGDPACALDTRRTIEINYLATKSIAEACKFNQINKFLFASTCSVYGCNSEPDKLLTEESELNPLSLYAETKLKSENGILGLSDENFSPTIFRFATLYGVSPRIRFDLMVNLFTAQATVNKKISIFGGGQFRPNVDVNDAASACLIWLESPIEKTGNEIFNIGSNEQNLQVIQIGELVKKIIPQTEIEIVEKEVDLRDYNVCFDKAKSALGFQPQETISEAIAKINGLIQSQEIKNFKEAKYNNYRFLMVSSQ